MRNISFALTKAQFRARTKTVTRRLGWKNLKPGEVLMGCEKCQGLKPGEKLVNMGPIKIVSVEREQLDQICDYPPGETAKEGFPEKTPWQFVEMFSEHMGCSETATVTRIEFEYL